MDKIRLASMGLSRQLLVVNNFQEKMRNHGDGMRLTVPLVTVTGERYRDEITTIESF